jgi:hypothetical protein
VRIVSKPELRQRKKGKKLNDGEGERELQGRAGFFLHELSLGSLHSHSFLGLVGQPTFVFVMTNEARKYFALSKHTKPV